MPRYEAKSWLSTPCIGEVHHILGVRCNSRACARLCASVFGSMRLARPAVLVGDKAKGSGYDVPYSFRSVRVWLAQVTFRASQRGYFDRKKVAGRMARTLPFARGARP